MLCPTNGEVGVHVKHSGAGATVPLLGSCHARPTAVSRPCAVQPTLCKRPPTAASRYLAPPSTHILLHRLLHTPRLSLRAGRRRPTQAAALPHPQRTCCSICPYLCHACVPVCRPPPTAASCCCGVTSGWRWRWRRGQRWPCCRRPWGWPRCRCWGKRCGCGLGVVSGARMSGMRCYSCCNAHEGEGEGEG